MKNIIIYEEYTDNDLKNLISIYFYDEKEKEVILICFDYPLLGIKFEYSVFHFIEFEEEFQDENFNDILFGRETGPLTSDECSITKDSHIYYFDSSNTEDVEEEDISVIKRLLQLNPWDEWTNVTGFENELDYFISCDLKKVSKEMLAKLSIIIDEIKEKFASNLGDAGRMKAFEEYYQKVILPQL